MCTYYSLNPDYGQCFFSFRNKMLFIPVLPYNIFVCDCVHVYAIPDLVLNIFINKMSL